MMDQILTLLGKVRDVLTDTLGYIESASSEQTTQKTAERIMALGLDIDTAKALLEKVSELKDPNAVAEMVLEELMNTSDLSLFKTAESRTGDKKRGETPKSQETWDTFINEV